MVAWAEPTLAPVVVLSEHHGVDGGYLPSPGPLAAAMAARTTSTFIMVAATVLPLHDPVRLAEDIAVIDHLSGGRVGWVFGVGYRPEEFALLDVEWAGRGRRMDHHLGVLLDALDGHDLATHGLGVEPGMCVLPPPDLPVSVFVADDVDAAWDEIGPYLLRSATDDARWNHGSTTTSSLSTATTIDGLRADAGAYRIVTVDEAVERATTGSLTLHPMCGGIPPEVAWPYLRRVSDEVAPVLADAG